MWSRSTIIPGVDPTDPIINTASDRTHRGRNRRRRRRRVWWAPVCGCCCRDCLAGPRRWPAWSAVTVAVVGPRSPIAYCSRRPSAPPTLPADSHTFSSPAIGPAVERINWNSQRSIMDSTRARCCHWHDTDGSYISLFPPFSPPSFYSPSFFPSHRQYMISGPLRRYPFKTAALHVTRISMRVD